jgi:hypothetical protein
VERQGAKPRVRVVSLGGKEIRKFPSAVATINPPGDEVEKASLRRYKKKISLKVGPMREDGNGKREGEERKKEEKRIPRSVEPTGAQKARCACLRRAGSG